MNQAATNAQRLDLIKVSGVPHFKDIDPECLLSFIVKLKERLKIEFANI